MTMSKLNIKVVRNFIEEVLNRGNLEKMEEYWDNDLIWHAGSFGEVKGIRDYKRMVTKSAEVLKQMYHQIDDIFACGNKVVVRFTHSATQAASFLGVPNSNKRISWLGIAIYKLDNCKITDAWFAEDLFGMMIRMENDRKLN